MDARGPEGLVGVDVADAAHEGLVEQRALDGRLLARERSEEAAVFEVRVERIAGDVRHLRGDDLPGDVRRLDEIIVRTIPDVQKAVKWNTPFYGLDGKTWFLGFHCLTKYVKVAFMQGAALDPMPPGTSKQQDVRYLDIYENDEIDEAQFVDWVTQASLLPGEKL